MPIDIPGVPLFVSEFFDRKAELRPGLRDFFVKISLNHPPIS